MSSPKQCLFPGYQQVDSFGPDEEYELEEEEVSYVTLDLGSIEPTLIPNSSTYRLIGLDTHNPFLQLSGTIFKGEHDSLLGSELLFTDAKDDTDRNRKSITHVATTEKRIRFREIQLKPKGNNASKPDEGGEIPSQPEYVFEQVGDTTADVGEGSGGGNTAKSKRKVKEKSTKGRSKSKGKKKEKETEQDTTRLNHGDVEMEGAAYPADAMNVDEG